VERNGVADRVELARGDAVEVLKGLRAQGRRFDLVVLDPPAFIRRRRDVEAGLQAYRRLNRLAMTVLAPDALLVSASCSSHLRRDRLRELLRVAAAGLGRELQILEQGFQGADHPVLPGLPETEYLKLFVTRVRAG
jgi:23S rRNA (cytosine1962-C5)-methyltransferase